MSTLGAGRVLTAVEAAELDRQEAALARELARLGRAFASTAEEFADAWRRVDETLATTLPTGPRPSRCGPASEAWRHTKA